MSYKKKIYWILFASITIFFAIFILTSPENFGLCEKNDIKCIVGYSDYLYKFNNLFPTPTLNIAKVILIFSIPLIILSLLLLFFQEYIFHTWAKFAAFFLPTTIVIAILMAYGSYGSFISFDEKIISLFFATIFLIMSIALILTKSFRPTWRLWIILPITFILSAIVMIIAAIVL